MDHNDMKNRPSRNIPIIRKGKACKVLPDGAPRRMSDGKNAYRKMSPEQREVFKAWIAVEDE